jgi:GDP-L-fucose synthase
MNKNSKIYVAGGTGLAGSAIISKLIDKGYTNIISTYNTHNPIYRFKNSKELREIAWAQLDLLDNVVVENFFKKEKPEYVFFAAAKVGGIIANNTYRADFIYKNLQIQNNVIYQSYKHDVEKLLFLGSTCIYPKECPQPMREEYLLTGPLEYSNEPYAIAKIAGIKMCESYNIQYGTNFISVMPTNLYGPYDNFDLEKSHVLPALMRKIYLGKLLENNDWQNIRKDLHKNPIENVSNSNTDEEIINILAKYGIRITTNLNDVQVEIWGSGKPIREFLFSLDMAEACVYLMENINFSDLIKDKSTTATPEIRNTHINIGTGCGISIKELAYIIKDIVGFNGNFYFNINKPVGTMEKITDVGKLHSFGWRHTVELEEGIKKLYKWYIDFLNVSE